MGHTHHNGNGGALKYNSMPGPREWKTKGPQKLDIRFMFLEEEKKKKKERKKAVRLV